MTTAEAAEAYAKTGICVVPIRPGTKNPGSYLGKGWPQLATGDLDTVRSWWRRWPTAGIATHIGASRLVVIDIDHPEHVPEWLWPLLEAAVFRPTESNPDSRRGHYFYQLRPGDLFNCGLGKLKPQGDKWGEVKCYGGAVVLGPTPHPRAAEGGRYSTGPAGSIPLVPDETADKLNTASDPSEYRSLAPGERDADAKRFLAKYTDDREPHALDPILRTFNPTAGERHTSMWDALCWAMREGKAGRFAAQHAVDELRESWAEAGSQPDPYEFDRMVRDAVAVADADGTVEELWDRAHRDGGDDREQRIAKRIRDLDERDEAQRRHDEQKAQRLLDVNADRAKSGMVFLTADADAEPLWGQGTQMLWAPGEGLMIVGPQGVGKSTVAQQLVLARMGIGSQMLFDMPVVRDERPILYLAMDRPAQIRRSMVRMLDLTNADVAAAIEGRLIVWEGPLPFDAAAAPKAFAEWVARRGRKPGALLVDSVKDLATGLTKDEVGAGFNEAVQLVLANGTDVVSLHHQRKANADNKKPDKLADVYGSNWLTAGQGSVLLLWGEPGASTVEVSHLKQPQEPVGPIVVEHAHAEGASTAIDPRRKLTALAIRASDTGITEADGVAEVYGIDDTDNGYVAAKSAVRRSLNRLTKDGVLTYEAGRRGGSGGGGKAARWWITG